MLRQRIKEQKGVTMSRKIALIVLIMLASLVTLNAYSIDGIVLGAPEMEPVAGAMVMLHAGQGVMFETETDEAGTFTLADLEAGDYMLHVMAEDFFAYSENIVLEEDMSIEVLLEVEENPGELTGHLYGIITNEDGEPAIGQEIMISTWNQNTQPHYVAYEAVTGEAGNYDFTEIVDFVDYEVMVFTGEQPFVTDVHVEGDTEFNFTIEEYEPGETWTLSGAITDAETGEAIPEINVVLHGWQGFVIEAISNEAGEYVIEGVPEGNYQLTVHGFGAGYEMFSEEIEIIEDTVYNIALVPAEQGELTLSGNVVDLETGAALAGVDIVLHGFQWNNYSTVSAEDGSYEFTGLFAGEYHLTAHLDEMNYLPFHADIELEESMEMNIELEGYEVGELTLSGTVTDVEGIPQSEIMVHLWGENCPGGMMLMSITDENGYYEITNILAGEYLLNVSGMQGMTLYEETIIIEENMVFDIVIDGEPGENGNLSGNVINAETGELVAGAQIVIQHGWEVYETFSGEDGQYSFNDVPVHNYQLIAFAEGYQQFTEQIYVEEETVFEIILMPFEQGDYSLTGTVTDAESGEAIGGVHIQIFGIENPMNHYNVNSNEAGEYAVNGIFEGTYQVMAWTNGWTPYEPFDGTVEIMEDTVFNIELVPFEMPGMGTIMGTVYDMNTEEPVTEAFVHIAPLENNPGGGCWNFYEAITDEMGFFEIPGIEAGEYIMAAEAEGYLLTFYEGVTSPEEALVISIEEEGEVTVEMPIIPLVLYSVSGIVTDFATGTPMGEVLVSATQPGSGCNHWAIAETLTNEDGTYVMEVPQGEYIFSARSGDYQSEDFMQQFYDHKQSPASADVVTVDQDITGIDFDLATPEFYDNQISGTITVEGSVPVNPVLVAAVSEGNQWEAATVTDMFGNYILNNLPEGNFYILAYEYSSVPTYYPGVIDFEEAVSVNALGNVSGIDFELILPENTGVFQVDGFVTDDNGNPVTNASVVIMDDQENVISYAITNNQGYYLANGLPAGSLAGLATKIHYQSDEESINVTTTGNADFVIIPEGTMDSPEDEITPVAELLTNYPNPFNPTTTISYTVENDGLTSIDVYNITGQKVTTLVNDYVSAGNHQVTWDGTDYRGNTLASGMYLYRLNAAGISVTQKMILMK